MLEIAPVLKHKEKKPTCMLQYEVPGLNDWSHWMHIKGFVVVAVLFF